MTTTYTRPFSGDFSGYLNTQQLQDEMNDPGASIGPECIVVINIGDNVDITFDAALSGPEITSMDAVIAAHAPIVPEPEDTEQINHSDVVLTAGVAISGGGDLTESRTFDVDITEPAEETIVDTATDFLLMYDASAGAHRKVKFENVISGETDAIATEYAASESTSSRTGTSYAQKLRLTFTADAATYHIKWSAECQTRDSGTLVKIRVQEDDATTHSEVNWGPDAQEEIGYGPYAGFVETTLTAGSHDFDMDFASSKSGETVRIRRARLSAIKVV